MSVFGNWEADCLRWRGMVLTGDWGHWCFDWDGLPVDETTDEISCCTCLRHPVQKTDIIDGVTFVDESQDYGPHHAIACTCGQLMAIPVDLFERQGNQFTEAQHAQIRAFKEDHSGGSHVLTYTMVDLTPIGIEKLTKLKD